MALDSPLCKRSTSYLFEILGLAVPGITTSGKRQGVWMAKGGLRCRKMILARFYGVGCEVPEGSSFFKKSTVLFRCKPCDFQPFFPIPLLLFGLRLGLHVAHDTLVDLAITPQPACILRNYPFACAHHTTIPLPVIFTENDFLAQKNLCESVRPHQKTIYKHPSHLGI